MESFVQFAESLREHLPSDDGATYDFVDPASGQLMLSTTTHVFSEAECVETFLTGGQTGFRVV